MTIVPHRLLRWHVKTCRRACGEHHAAEPAVCGGCACAVPCTWLGCAGHVRCTRGQVDTAGSAHGRQWQCDCAGPYTCQGELPCHCVLWHVCRLCICKHGKMVLCGVALLASILVITACALAVACAHTETGKGAAVTCPANQRQVAPAADHTAM